MKRHFLRILTVMLLCSLMLFGCALSESTENDWYIERAAILRDDLMMLSADREYLSLYSGNDTLIDLASAWHEELSGEPVRSGRYYMPTDIIRLGIAVSGTKLSDTALKYLSRAADNFVLSTITASQGVNFIAASSMLRIGESFIMPEDFKPCIVLYEYESICVAVLFTQTGEGVVGANAAICSNEIRKYCLSVSDSDDDAAQMPAVGGSLIQNPLPIPQPDRMIPSPSGSEHGK